MNVLFHINESSKWEMVLGNIQNMIQYLDQEAMHYRIELVANGPAVCELQDAVSEKMSFKKLCMLFPQIFGSVSAAIHCAEIISLLNVCCHLLKLSRQA